MKLKNIFAKIIRSDYTTVFTFDLLAKLLMVVATVFLVRILTTDEYALYTNFSEIGNLMLTIIGTGLSIPYITYSSEQNSRGNSHNTILFNTCCILIAFVSIVSFVLLPVITYVYKLPLILAIIGLLYGGFQSQNKLCQAYFQAKNEFQKSGFITNFKNLLLVVIIGFVFLIFHQISALSAAVVTMTSAVIVFFVCVFWIWKDNRSKNLQISSRLLVNLLSESKWLILYLIFQSFFSSICIIILNKFGTNEDVANFGVAYKYYNLLLMFLTSLQTVLRVKTSQKDIVDSAEKRRIFSMNWLKRIWPIVGIITLIGIISAPFIFPFINGKEYTSSIIVFQILMISVFLGYSFSPNTSIMIAAKRHKLLFIIAVVCCVIGGAICYFLLPYLGVAATAISITVSNFVLNFTVFIIILTDKKESVVQDTSE
jgi:O-antigen/teichoic acid export membrane protein